MSTRQLIPMRAVPKFSALTRVSHPLLQRKCACSGSPGLSGECEDCSKQRLQHKSANSEVGVHRKHSVPPIVHEVLRSSGRPLDTTTRSFMESRFSHDFSYIPAQRVSRLATADLNVSSGRDHLEQEADRLAGAVMRTDSASAPRSAAHGSGKFDFRNVRVHDDASVASSAKALDALAYTVGPNLVFAAGQYSPHTTSGRKLIAHELTHVLQQGQVPQSLQRQEDPRVNPGEGLQRDEADSEEDEDVEDGDTDVIGLVETPDFDVDPHGPEPLAKDDPSVTSVPGRAAPPLGRLPTGKIRHIDVDQDSQTMLMTFSDGQKHPHTVSTGRGECGTAGDPCKTQKEHHCTPNGTFLIVSRGDENTANSRGDAMAWFVALDIPGRKGIGIHNSQLVDGTPRSHGCVRVGKKAADKAFAKMINEHVIVKKTDVTISGKAKTNSYPCDKKKKKKP